MAHYRKIDVAIWNDEKFSSLSIGGKFAYLFLLTHPSMTGLGGMRASIAGLSDESGAAIKDFKEVFSSGLALFDDKAKCLFVPNFLRYQATEKINPNIVKGLVKQSEFIPESSIKELALRNVLFFIEELSPSLREGFDDAFAKQNGRIFHEVYGDFSSKENSVSFAKTIRFLPQSFVDFLRKPVSIKQLAVSKPPIPTMSEIGKTLEVVEGKKPVAIDPDTGEVIEWAA